MNLEKISKFIIIFFLGILIGGVAIAALFPGELVKEVEAAALLIWIIVFVVGYILLNIKQFDLKTVFILCIPVLVCAYYSSVHIRNALTGYTPYQQYSIIQKIGEENAEYCEKWVHKYLGYNHFTVTVDKASYKEGYEDDEPVYEVYYTYKCPELDTIYNRNDNDKLLSAIQNLYYYEIDDMTYDANEVDYPFYYKSEWSNPSLKIKNVRNSFVVEGSHHEYIYQHGDGSLRVDDEYVIKPRTTTKRKTKYNSSNSNSSSSSSGSHKSSGSSNDYYDFDDFYEDTYGDYDSEEDAYEEWDEEYN